MKSCRLSLRAHGFSLIEILMVMAILTVLMVSGSLISSSVQRASQITQDITILADDLSKASLEAIRINRPIHFRFYRFTDPIVDSRSIVQGYQTLVLDPESRSYIQLEKIKRFAQGIAIVDNAMASTILSLPETRPVTRSGPNVITDPELATIAPYSYYEFEFRPDGSTNLPKDKAWGIAIAFHLESIATGGVPDGFHALGINPFTGAVTVY